MIGPVIDDGFYYDIAYERPFTPDDMAAIDRIMAFESQAGTVVEDTEDDK